MLGPYGKRTRYASLAKSVYCEDGATNAKQVDASQVGAHAWAFAKLDPGIVDVHHVPMHCSGTQPAGVAR